MIRISGGFLKYTFAALMIVACADRPVEPVSAGDDASQSARPLSGRFGIALGGGGAPSPEMHQSFGVVRDAGVNWVRVAVRWRTTERRPGIYDWDNLDSLVATLRRRNMNVLAVVSGTPPWASSAPQAVLADTLGECAKKAYTAYPPKDSLVWANFMRTAALRYKGRVAGWEIWNEPDLKPLDSATTVCNGGAWCGTRADYAQLLTVGARAVRAADPDAKVVLAGLAMVSRGDSSFLSGILSDPTHPAGPAFDVANFHFYDEPLLAAGSVRQVRQKLAAAGVGNKPIWVTETGRRSSPTDSVQTTYLDRVYREFFSVGVERVFWFRLIDDETRSACGAPLSGYGLIRKTLEPKPSINALRLLAFESVGSRTLFPRP